MYEEKVRRCEACGELFVAKNSNQKFCNRVCYQAKREELENMEIGIYEKKCPACGKEFSTNKKMKIYCCQRCADLYNKRIQRSMPTNMAQQKKAKKSAKNIVNYDAEAKKHGMTYGQYVAWLYMQEHRLKKEN